MVTIGRGLNATVHDLFEGLRSYDAARAAKRLAPDADWESPWHGRITGRQAIEAALKAWLADPVKRPSLTIIDLAGDGAITHLKLSVSGRFGKAPEHVTMSVLCLKDTIHHVAIRPAAAGAGH